MLNIPVPYLWCSKWYKKMFEFSMFSITDCIGTSNFKDYVIISKKWTWNCDIMKFVKICYGKSFEWKFTLWIINGLETWFCRGQNSNMTGLSVGGLWPSSTLLDTPTPYTYEVCHLSSLCNSMCLKSTCSEYVWKSKFILDVRRGVSKGIEDGRRPPSLWAGLPRYGYMTVSGVACPEGVVGHGWPWWNFRESMATPCHTPMKFMVG
jgi:hypothetical protein